LKADAPLLVELIGQPGAGKTTLARAATAGSELHTRGELGSAWAHLPILTKASLFGRAILDGACLARAIQLALGARLFRGDSLSRLFRLLIKSHWIRAQSGRLLLEEGCLQDLWSIYYSAGRWEPEPRQLAPLIRCLYRGVRARLVFLEVDPQRAFDRIRGRTHGKSRLDRLAEADLRQHLANTAQLPHKLADAARLAGLGVETLDASLPVETTVRRLRAVMQELDLFPTSGG
jgi:hypothetical protein